MPHKIWLPFHNPHKQLNLRHHRVFARICNDASTNVLLSVADATSARDFSAPAQQLEAKANFAEPQSAQQKIGFVPSFCPTRYS